MSNSIETVKFNPIRYYCSIYSHNRSLSNLQNLFDLSRRVGNSLELFYILDD